MNKYNNHLSNDKVSHSKAVAEYMRDNCPNGLDPNEMYLLGFIHDIGYLFQKDGHGTLGGLLLKAQGYKYYEEVYHHGDPHCEYKSKELDLLNLADLSINSKGEFVGISDRLEDIKTRYGAESKNYLNAVLCAEQISLRLSIYFY